MSGASDLQKRLRIALDQLLEIQNMLQEHQRTHQDRVLSLISQKMKDMAPELAALSKHPDSRSAENKPLLTQLSVGMKAAFADHQQRIAASKSKKGGNPTRATSGGTAKSATPLRHTSGGGGGAAAERPAASPKLSHVTLPSVQVIDFNNPSSLVRIEERPPVLRGWLKKQGDKGLIQRWSRRFFQIDDEHQRLVYARTDNIKDPQGFVRLDSIWKIVSREVEGRFLFDLYVEGARIYHLETDSSPLMNYWVEGLKNWRFWQIHSRVDDEIISSLQKNATPVPSSTPSPPLNPARSTANSAGPPAGLSRFDPISTGYQPPSSALDLVEAKSAYTPSYTSYSSTLTPFTTTTAPSNYASATSSIGGDAKGGAYIPSFLSSAVPEAPSYSSMSTASLDLPMPTMFTPGGADRAATPSSDRAVNPYSSSSLLDNKPDYTSPYRSSQTSTSSTPSYDRKPETTGNTYSYDRKPEMSTFSSYPTSDFSKASGAPSHHSDDGLSSMAVKYTRACEELEHEKEKTRRLEAEVESLRRLQQHSEPGQYRKVAASSGSSDQERAPMSFEGFRQQLEKAFFTRQQQDAIVDRLEEFDREYRIREEEFSLLREQQQTAYEELRVRDQSIRDLQDALTRSKMELQAKDKHLEIIDAQLKEARGTGRFDARSHKGSSANEQSTQQLIADLRDTCKAHQAQNALLGQELSATQESVGAIIRAKSARIADLKQHLDDSRHAFQALRKKYLLSQGLDQDILLELENTRKELFYALAVGIKLNMAESGANTNVDVASMYDEAKNLHYSKWNDWILKRIDEQTLAFRHANRLVTVPSHGGSFRSPGPNRSTSHPGHRAAAAHHSPPKSRQSDRSTSQRDYADTRVGTDARLATYSKPPQKPKSNFFQRMFD